MVLLLENGNGKEYYYNGRVQFEGEYLNGKKISGSGEGADEIFGGYLYFHKAPDARAFHEETVRKLGKLYLYDCLRANKSLAAWGVEGRVPFLDKEFLDVAMRTNHEAKMCPGNTMEKKIVREAFADMLPAEVAWRQKEEMCKTIMFKGELEIVSYNDDGELTIKDTDGENYTFYLKGE